MGPFLGLTTFLLMASLLFHPPPLAAQGTGNKLVAAPAVPSRKKNPNQQPPENVTGAKTLKVKVNFVAVPVVVRDSAGRAVGNLHREDFQIFDNRKPEEITQFMMVQAEQSATASTASLSVKGTKFVVPDRFTAILFDDVHSTFQNLPQLQAASSHLVANALARSERLGIFTTSGKLTVDFTDDRAKLQDAIRKLKPNPLPGSLATSCPRLSHYDANQIVNRNDLAAREAAISEVMGQCGVKDPKVAAVIVMAAAQRVLLDDDEETSLVLRALVDLRDMPHRQVDDQDANELRLVAAVFDRNGK
jgi:VWFA-related protein